MFNTDFIGFFITPASSVKFLDSFNVQWPQGKTWFHSSETLNIPYTLKWRGTDSPTQLNIQPATFYVELIMPRCSANKYPCKQINTEKCWSTYGGGTQTGHFNIPLKSLADGTYAVILQVYGKYDQGILSDPRSYNIDWTFTGHYRIG